MTRKITGDNVFKILVAIIAASALIILVANAIVLGSGSGLVLNRFGFSF